MIVFVVLLDLYAVLVALRLVLSWVDVPATGAMASITRLVYASTEPVLAVIRSVVRPVNISGDGVDLSPLLLLVALWLLASLLFR